MMRRGSCGSAVDNRVSGVMRVGQKVKQNAQNRVNRQKLNAFDPMAFAVRTDLLYDQNRRKNR
jgi:hypothetical protein